MLVVEQLDHGRSADRKITPYKRHSLNELIREIQPFIIFGEVLYCTNTFTGLVVLPEIYFGPNALVNDLEAVSAKIRSESLINPFF